MGKTNIAWNLETTGFSAVSGQITATGFARPQTDDTPQSITLYLNTDGRADEVDASLLRDCLSEHSGYDNVALSIYDSERELLDAMDSYADNMEFRTERLVTYNGEKWTGGFALPFTRTRCVSQETGWIFENVPHLDLSESIQKRFNTQVSSLGTMTADELRSFAEFLDVPTEYVTAQAETDALRSRINETGFSQHDLEAWAGQGVDRELPTGSLDTLVGSHGMLVDWDDADDFDPCADGGEVVNAFTDGEFDDVALHTLADLTRVSDLADLIEEYVCDRYIEELRL